MISNQIIANCIREAAEMTKMDFAVVDSIGVAISSTNMGMYLDKAVISSFFSSEAVTQECQGLTFFKVFDDEEAAYTLVVSGEENVLLIGKLVATQLKNLIIAYKEKIDRNSFFQNLLLDNMLLVDMYNKAKKLHISTNDKRCVFVIESAVKSDDNLQEIVKELFYTQNGDFVTAVDEEHIVIIKSIDESDEDTLRETAKMLVDMASSEAMLSVRVAYGNIVDDIRGISKSYKEAMMALDVGKIFYIEKSIIAYNSLGIGRLIYQLPINLCQLYVKEIFGEDIPEEIDDDMLNTVNKFFENNLNVSETSRQLCMHRNTLLYRIEKVQKTTGLDIRVFDDALALKIALMVVNYIRFIEEKDN